MSRTTNYDFPLLDSSAGDIGDALADTYLQEQGQQVDCVMKKIDNNLYQLQQVKQELAGGTAGQILSKNSNSDYDFIWINNSGGGGGLNNATVKHFDSNINVTTEGEFPYGTDAELLDNDSIVFLDSDLTGSALKYTFNFDGGYMDPNDASLTVIYDSSYLNLTRVVIPDYALVKNPDYGPNVWGKYPITQIANGAFKNCSSLTTIKIGKNVKYIGIEAFMGCPYISILDLKNVDTIDDKAFYLMGNLHKVTMNNVKYIFAEIFSNTSSLFRSITLPASLTYISDTALKGSRINSIKIIKDDDSTFANAPFGATGATVTYYRRITDEKLNAITNNTTAITNIKDGTTIDSFGDVESALADKVDKVNGKGLSENDFTDTLKNKLDGIASGAEVNVQSNWNETNTAADSYIQNKPSIPNKTSDLTNDSGFITNSDITSKLDKTTVEGGTTGQVLAKKSNTDYDFEWVNQSGGGGVTPQNILDNLDTSGDVVGSLNNNKVKLDYNSNSKPLVNKGEISTATLPQNPNEGDYYVCSSSSPIDVPTGESTEEDFAIGDNCERIQFDTTLTTAQVKTILESLTYTRNDEFHVGNQVTGLKFNTSLTDAQLEDLLSSLSYDQGQLEALRGDNGQGMNNSLLYFVDISVFTAYSGYLIQEGETSNILYSTAAIPDMGVSQGWQNLTDGKFEFNETYTLTDVNSYSEWTTIVNNDVQDLQMECNLLEGGGSYYIQIQAQDLGSGFIYIIVVAGDYIAYVSDAVPGFIETAGWQYGEGFLDQDGGIDLEEPFTIGDVYQSSSWNGIIASNVSNPMITLRNNDWIWFDGTDWRKVDNQQFIPAGGSTNQVLTKKSNSDYDLEWKDAGSNGVWYDFGVIDTTKEWSTIADFGRVLIPTAAQLDEIRALYMNQTLAGIKYKYSWGEGQVSDEYVYLPLIPTRRNLHLDTLEGYITQYRMDDALSILTLGYEKFGYQDDIFVKEKPFVNYTSYNTVTRATKLINQRQDMGTITDINDIEYEKRVTFPFTSRHFIQDNDIFVMTIDGYIKNIISQMSQMCISEQMSIDILTTTTGTSVLLLNSSGNLVFNNFNGESCILYNGANDEWLDSFEESYNRPYNWVYNNSDHSIFITFQGILTDTYLDFSFDSIGNNANGYIFELASQVTYSEYSIKAHTEQTYFITFQSSTTTCPDIEMDNSIFVGDTRTVYIVPNAGESLPSSIIVDGCSHTYDDTTGEVVLSNILINTGINTISIIA